MSLSLRKKSNSWHKNSPSTEKCLTQLISSNNKSIFSDILQAKLDRKSSLTRSKKTQIGPKVRILEETSSFSSKNLNLSFSRFAKCDYCGLNSFYQQPLKTAVKEMLKTNRNSPLDQEISKIKNYCIDDLKTQSKALKSTSEYQEKPIIKLESLPNFPMLPNQNYYQEYILPEIDEKTFRSKAYLDRVVSNNKPVESTFMQAVLSLKKLLPTAFSNKSMSRKDIITLKKWLANQEEILGKHNFKNLEAKTNAFFELYTICLNEVIQEISIECSEKGEIITEIWQKFLDLLASHRVFVEQETKKMKESTQILIDSALSEQKKVLDKSEQLLKAKIEELAALKRKDRDREAKMLQMESTNKGYWEEGQKYRYLCKTLNERYVALKKDFKNLNEKYEKNIHLNGEKHKPDIFVNDRTPDSSHLNTPKNKDGPTLQLKPKEESLAKQETPSSTNKFSEITSLTAIKSILTLGEVGSQEKIKVPEQIQSIFKKQDELIEKNERLLRPSKPSLIEKLPIAEEVQKLKGKPKESKKSKENNQINNKKKPRKPITKIAKLELQAKKNDDSDIDSKESFLSNLEICEEERNQITMNELNGLVKMVHPDKFQVVMVDVPTQIYPDLYESWHNDQAIQTTTFLMESKYDLVFSTNKEIQEFLNDYAQKKEIQQLLHNKNSVDLENFENAAKIVDEMIEESLHSNDKFIEIKALLLESGTASPSRRSPEGELELERLESQLPDPLKQGIEIATTMTNSPMLRYKTMTKTKESLLKLMRVYFKENSKNIILGNEIRLLNELLQKEKSEREDLELRYNELLKKLENIPMAMPFSQKLAPYDSSSALLEEFNIDEDVDEKEEKEIAGLGVRRKKGKMVTTSKEEKAEIRIKALNPGIQLIQQIKSKNIAKFQNVLSFKMVYKTIYQIYLDRITLLKENPKGKEIDCQSFSYNFFIKCYGFKKMAQQKFILFVLTLKKSITQLRINVFSKFLGLLQNTMNYNLEEFNQYILALDYASNYSLSNTDNTINPSNISTFNKETDPRFMVNFPRMVEYAKALEKECENNEFMHFKKEIEAIKEEDPKNYLKTGVVDFDMFMSKYLAFYRQIKNQGKRNLVLAFKSADLNSDGLVDLFEFDLVIKSIESELYISEKKEGIQNIFDENADWIINKDEKHMSFNHFCCVSEQNGLFEMRKNLKFIDLIKEEEGTKLFNGVLESWKRTKQELMRMAEILEEKQFWFKELEKLEKKKEKAQNDEKLKLPTFIGMKMIEKEIKELYNNKRAINEDALV